MDNFIGIYGICISTIFISSHHLNQLLRVFEASHNIRFLLFYIDLPLDAICAVCHQFGLLSTDLHLICGDYKPGLLVPSLSQLDYLGHRQTTGW